MHRIASFDIGFKNFAFCVEEYDEEDFKKFIHCGHIFKYNVDGTAAGQTLTKINELKSLGKTLHFSNDDISRGEASVTTTMLQTITDLLDFHGDLLDTCCQFVVEKQMSFGKMCNPKAVRLGHHLQSALIIRYGNLTPVIEFPAYHKTQLLGASKERKIGRGGKVKYKSVGYGARKKWSVETAIECLAIRGDFETIDDLMLLKKRDDVCDCILQSIAYIISLANKC
jgi:hypothetical protein